MQSVIVIRKKHLWVVAAMLMTSVLACMCQLDRSAIGSPAPAVHTFDVVPQNVVCGSEIDQVTVSWSITQPSGCSFNPGIVSCDPLTEFFIGCPELAPRCNSVSVVASPEAIDPAVTREESEGSRTMTISETTTFTMSVNGEERESITVEVLNAGERGGTFPITVNRTCVDGRLEAERIDLPQMFSQCVQLEPLCNLSDRPVVVLNTETREEHRLAPGACTPFPVGQPSIWLVRDEMPFVVDPCAGMADGSVVGSGDPPMPDLPPFHLSISVNTCGTFDPDEEVCVFTATEPVIAVPPTPTAPVNGALCADQGGIANQSEVCTCQGVIDQVTFCGNGTKIDTITNTSCEPNPADCQPTSDVPVCACNFVCAVADPNKPEQCLQGQYLDCNGVVCTP